MTTGRFMFVALNGSPSGASKTHTIAARAVEMAGSGTVIDIGALDADALLLRRTSTDVTEALQQLERATVVLFATPVYRATYSGLLKVLLDQLPPHGLLAKACILSAVGGSDLHSLAVSDGLRPLVASLDGWAVPTSFYGTPDDFDEAGRLRERGNSILEQAIAEARLVVGAADV
jgi:FMN reductase